MDKNFIKVDDLFRQRLGDGEERERSGAWLNMRELLDKEMPQQKRIGAFYWRRLFSAVAALSLIGTVCVSSYELSAAFRNRAVSAVIPEVPVSVNGEPARTLSMTQDDHSVAKDVRGVSRISATREPSDSRQTANVNVVSADNGSQVSAPATATNENTIKHLNNSNSNNSNTTNNSEGTAATQPITIDANVHGAEKTTNNKVKSGNKINAAKPAKKTESNTGGSSAIASHSAENVNVAPAKQVSEGNVEPNNNTNALSAGTDHAIAMSDRTATRDGANKGSGHVLPVNNTSKAASKSHKQSENRDQKMPGDAARNAVASRGQNEHVGAKSNTQTDPGSATGSNVAASNAVANGERVAAKGSKSSNANLPGTGHKPANMALNSSVANKAGNKSASDAHVAANSDKLHKSASDNINKLAAADVAAIEKAGATQNKMATLDIPSAVAEVANDGGAANKKVSEETPSLASQNQKESATPTGQSIHDQPSSGKKVITKLVVHERTFKVADNEYELRSDTISKERIVMDMNEKNEPAVAKPSVSEEVPATVSSKKTRKRLFGQKNAGVTASTPGMAGASTPTQHKSGTPAVGNNGASSSVMMASAASSASAAGASGSSEFAPAASASAKSSSASEIMPAAATEEGKAKATESKHKGMSMVKKLALAFNDVKNNASKTTFAPGLTAGVNSYFFGPSTLKGFQLGLTGDIIFNDSWNVMTELKYFHRVNNNTSIQDNYYSYTPVGAQYLKQLQMNSYSFSALHSVEMPVAIRYHMGNFNFYAGGNFLYAFSINTGATAMPSYSTAAEYVNTPGTDDKGVLSEADFKSRFGLGYLFGFSYNLSQNFSLDLRNVQTVWDNAASTGAKSISTQLYRTPSIQLSVMYRIGGNRSKD